nr:aldo/keto reductase [Streptomyces sp. NBC_00830]
MPKYPSSSFPKLSTSFEQGRPHPRTSRRLGIARTRPRPLSNRRPPDRLLPAVGAGRVRSGALSAGAIIAFLLDAAEALARPAEDAGLTLVQPALAFVLEHPAVTSAIIGPRTFEQPAGRLGADRVRLSRDVLDQIDKIVPPGSNLSARDAGYQPVALTDPALRRRSARSA